MKLRPLVRIIWPTVAALVMGAGCAEVPLKIPPPSDTAGARFGTVAIGPVRFDRSRDKLQELGANVARGISQGAFEGFGSAFKPAFEGCEGVHALSNSCGVFFVYGIAAAPFTTAIGAIRSHPAEEVEAAERSLLAAFKRINPRVALHDQIILAGKSKTDLVFVEIDDERPETLSSGSNTGFDSIMTLYFEQFLLFDDDHINPGVTLELQLTAYIVEATDATPLHTQIWKYRSEQEKFFNLAENATKRVEELTAKAYESLARKIVHDLFIATTPETQNSGQPGTAWTVETSSFYDVRTAPRTEAVDIK